METSNLELAIEMLKKSVDFRCQQIDFIIKDKYLIIWSTYNSDEKRVELTVYSIFDFA